MGLEEWQHEVHWGLAHWPRLRLLLLPPLPLLRLRVMGAEGGQGRHPGAELSVKLQRPMERLLGQPPHRMAKPSVQLLHWLARSPVPLLHP